MNRTQLTLGGILIVQLLLILILRSPFSDASHGAGARPLVTGLDGASATRLELVGRDDEKLTLERDDGVWRVEQADGFPADENKIDALLDDVARLEVRRPVVGSSRYHSALKVTEDENEGRVRLWAEGSDEPRIDLLLGTSPNYGSTHVRLAGEDAVYEAGGLAGYDVRPDVDAWVDLDLVDVPQADVVGLSLANANGKFDLERRDGTWSAADPQVRIDPLKLDGLLRSVSSLRLDGPVGRADTAAHGFDSPAATLTLRLADRELSVTVGRPVADDAAERYITRAGLGYTGSIPETSVRPLLDATLDGLLAAPPESVE